MSKAKTTTTEETTVNSNVFNTVEVNAQVDKFNRNLGNGALAFEAMAFVLEASTVTRNTDPVVKMIATAEKRGDTIAAAVIKKAMIVLWPGVKAKKTDKGLAYKVSGVQHSADMLVKIKSMVERKVSIRNGKAINEAFKVAKPEQAFAIAPKAQRFAKTVFEETHMDEAAFLEAMRTAYRAAKGEAPAVVQPAA